VFDRPPDLKKVIAWVERSFPAWIQRRTATWKVLEGFRAAVRTGKNRTLFLAAGAVMSLGAPALLSAAEFNPVLDYTEEGQFYVWTGHTKDKSVVVFIVQERGSYKIRRIEIQ